MNTLRRACFTTTVSMRIHTTHTRDAALRELNRLTRWLIAASVVLTGVLSDVAASAFSGKTTKHTTAKKSTKHKAHKTFKKSAAGALKPPAQTPTTPTETQPPQEATPESAPAQEPAPSNESAPTHESAPAQEAAPESAPAQEAAPEQTAPPAEESGPVVSGGS